MKKDVIFAPVMLLIAVLLFLLKTTGMTAHIVISVIGVLALAVYTSATRKTWEIPALEIAMRACYGIALIAGFVIKASGIAPVAVVHKAAAALFVVLLAVLFVMKLLARKK